MPILSRTVFRILFRQPISLIVKRNAHQCFKTPEPARGPPLPPQESPRSGAKTMLHYILSIQQKYPEAVVMTQVGSFMELYFDQAIEFGPLLNLRVTRKQQRSPIPGKEVYMAGFPLQQKEKYEKTLVKDLGKNVVTLMQDSKHVLGGGTEEEKRPVHRILTPGTLLDESFVDQNVNNYLASVSVTQQKAVVTWVDVASGVVKYQEMDVHDLGNVLARIAPLEVIFDRKSTYREFIQEIVAQYAPNALANAVKYPPREVFNTRADHVDRFRFEKYSQEVQKSFLGLLRYIERCMPGLPIELQEPELFVEEEVMHLDSRARAALEITTTSSGSTKGSLFSTVKRTSTLSGSRLLQEWLSSPLNNTDEIRKRQDKVQFFLDQSRSTLSQLQLLLSELPDGPRVLQKLRQPRVNPRDLIVFARSVKSIQSISEVLLQLKDVPADWRAPLKQLLDAPIKSAEEILAAINSEALDIDNESTTTGTGSAVDIINNETESADKSVGLTPKRSNSSKRKPAGGRKQPGASSGYTFEPATNRDYKPVLNAEISERLKEIYHRQTEFTSREQQISMRLKSLYGPSAELRWSPSHQFYVYIVINGRNEPEPHLLLSKNKKTAYLSDAEWSALGCERLELSSMLRAEEERIFNDFRDVILTDLLSPMRTLYSLIDQLDVQMSLAALAMERRLVRPEVVEDSSIFEIHNGRHITVETGLALGGFANSGFVSNDCSLSAPKRVCMITGPNMGGKSTFIRQSALIALLAHIGSFVPAESARIGIVDRIFCRIGAGDDLYSGRSTFMVEMLETAAILNNATSKSLAIIDEVGRGTSGKDGLAIAFAAINHLVSRTQCRTLFATHFGKEIWDALCADSDKGTTDGIRLLQASLQMSEDGEPIFDYRLRPGISTSSCGILIAEMAGFPEKALNDAKRLVSAES